MVICKYRTLYTARNITGSLGGRRSWSGGGGFGKEKSLAAIGNLIALVGCTARSLYRLQQQNNYEGKGKGKMIPLQARCGGPEGG